MSYNPKKYWKNRSNITPRDVPERVKAYITDKIKDAETILDFGCGNGRFAELFKGKDVVGYDIVDRSPPYPITDALEGNYDAIVATKVLLHISDISDTIERLKKISNTIIVWDAVGQDAPHVFDHDFSKYGTMKDVQQWDNELLFTYGN